MSNIAYLVEAHADVKQLIRLCDALVLSGDVYVHVDRKQRDHTFWEELNIYCQTQCRVKVLKDRVYVAWAGFSQVKAFLKLLCAAMVSDKRYDRFVLLSGMDFPVWSPIAIHEFFDKNEDREFVCGYNISQCKFDYQLRKIKYYHFFRDLPLPHKSFFRRAIIGGTALTLKYMGIHRKPYFYDGEANRDVYFGSSWIAITYDCAKYLKNELENNPKISRYFKTVYAPDELCVPTLVMNSPFADKAIHVEELSFQAVTPLHYLNYEDCIWSYDENDYDTIVASGKMFVRKLVSGKSEKLAERIIQSWGDADTK